MVTTEVYVDSLNTWNQTISGNENNRQPFLDITRETLDSMRYFTDVVISPVVYILGIVGNSVGLCVLGKDKANRQMTIYVYLLALLAFDILYLFVSVLDSVVAIIKLYDNPMSVKLLVAIGNPCGYLDFLFNHVSVYLLIIMSIERLMVFVYPMGRQNSFLSKYPYRVVFTGFFVFALYLLPFPISLQYVEIHTPQNKTAYKIIRKEGFENVHKVGSLLELAVLQLIAPAIVFVVNTLILIFYSRFLTKRATTLNTDKKGAKNQRKITIVVVVACGMYFLLSMPNTFIQVLRLIDSDYSFDGRYRNTFAFFFLLGDLFARINAAVDFFLYILVSTKFRRIFREMIFKDAFTGSVTTISQQVSKSHDK